jgi:hypothetical protein
MQEMFLKEMGDGCHRNQSPEPIGNLVTYFLVTSYNFVNQ